MDPITRILCACRCVPYIWRQCRSHVIGHLCGVCAVLCCRQRRKERKQQRRLQRQNHQEEEGGENQNVRKRLRREVAPSSLRLVVDCSFDNLMLIKVRSSGRNLWPPHDLVWLPPHNYQSFFCFQLFYSFLFLLCIILLYMILFFSLCGFIQAKVLPDARF